MVRIYDSVVDVELIISIKILATIKTNVKYKHNN